MYLRKRIRPRHILWDSWPVLVFASGWAIVVDLLHDALGYNAFAVPILPVTTIGIIVSLYIGFKSTQTYNRWWEARCIWGAIVNDSRAWATECFTLIDLSNENERTTAEMLVRRHLAWVNALAYQLRKTSRMSVSPHQRVFDFRVDTSKMIGTNKPDCYERYITDEEANHLREVANPATHILHSQGETLRTLHKSGRVDSVRLVGLMQLVRSSYDNQGKCERIKNTPFPRQISLFGRVFTWLFILFLPLAFVESFEGLSQKHELTVQVQHEYMLILIPFTMLISWIFYTVEKIGDSCEDPFEGGTTDVPISSLTRTIEIDLLQILGSKDVPAKLEPHDGVMY